MDIEQRIERLERQNRGMKVVVSVLVVILVGGVLLGGPLSAREANAQARAGQLTPEQAHAARLFAEQRRHQETRRETRRAGSCTVDVGVVVAEEFCLVGGDGEVRATLTMFRDEPYLVFLDETGKACLSLGAAKDGAELVFPNENGKPHAALGMGKDGPRLLLTNPVGKASVVFGVLKDMPGGILVDAKGNQIWSAP